MPIPFALSRDAAAEGFEPRHILPDGASAVDAGLAALKPIHRSIDNGANGLKPRQVVTGIIPTYYRVDGPAPGTVAGIVLGSVVGFLFLLWLINVIRSPGGAFNFPGEEEVVRRRDPRSPRSRHSHHSRRSSGIEVREVSRSPRRERIIVDERRAAPRRSRSIVVEERVEHRVPGDDIVEVIEGSDITPPPRRTRSRRTSDYRY